jgi:hypothetical protein
VTHTISARPFPQPTLIHKTRTRLRNETNAERLGMRQAVARMTAVEHELTRRLDAFSVRLADSEKQLEATFRVEHSGHDPERPLSWRAAASHESRPGR